MGESRLDHEGDSRHILGVAAFQRVAAQFEATAKGRQLRKSRVTGRTGLAGLARETRQGGGRIDGCAIEGGGKREGGGRRGPKKGVRK